MGAVGCFEDLVTWQKVRTLAASIYRATHREPFARDFGLAGQIQRSAVSVMSNIAEGFERGSRAEFHQFLWIAKGSCAELRSQLYVARDVGYLSQVEFDGLLAQSQEVARIIGGLRASVQKQKAAGTGNL